MRTTKTPAGPVRLAGVWFSVCSGWTKGQTLLIGLTGGAVSDALEFHRFDISDESLVAVSKERK